jgi:His-Xaa-Ser system protein HxsD
VTADLKSADTINWATDSLGALAYLTVDTSIYGKTAVFKTAYWYTERCYLFLSRVEGSPNSIQIEIRPKSIMSNEELVAVCREFANNLIDQQVRQEVIAETGNIRDALIKKAFFEGSHHRDPDTLHSNEKYVPAADQSYTNDPLKIGRITGS